MKAPLLHSLVLSCAALVGCASPDHYALRQNKAIIVRYFDRWANHVDQAVANELIATDLVLHNPPAVLHSLAEYKTSMAAFHAAFPDLHFTIEEKFASGKIQEISVSMDRLGLMQRLGWLPTPLSSAR